MANERPSTRTASARRRARTAKLALGSLAALAFGVGFVGARSNAPGHAKGRLRPLSAPQQFQQAVRQSALSAGTIAPPQQPPVVQATVS